MIDVRGLTLSAARTGSAGASVHTHGYMFQNWMEGVRCKVCSSVKDGANTSVSDNVINIHNNLRDNIDTSSPLDQ